MRLRNVELTDEESRPGGRSYRLQSRDPDSRMWADSNPIRPTCRQGIYKPGEHSARPHNSRDTP